MCRSLGARGWVGTHAEMVVPYCALKAWGGDHGDRGLKWQQRVRMPV